MFKKAIKFFFKENRNERIRLYFPICFAFWFMFVIFGPFDLFFQNQAEFPFDFSEVLFSFVAMFLLFLFCSILLTVIMPKIMAEMIVCIFSGLLLASYIQLLFLNGNMPPATGDIVYYSDIPNLLNINTFIWTCLFLTPFCLYAISKKRRSNIWRRGITYLSIVLVVMQVAGLTANFIAKEPTSHRTDDIYYFSYDKQFTLSKEDNIIIIMLDRMDTIYVQDVFDKYPEAQDIFTGFTFYQNNIATHLSTYPSVVNMMTGEKYDHNLNRHEYLSKAWDNYTSFNILHEQNYMVNMLPIANGTYTNPKQLFGIADNIKTADPSHRKVNYKEIIKTSISFSLVKFAPYILKNNINSYNVIALDELITITGLSDYHSASLSPSNDLTYYEKLKSIGLNSNSSTKTFSFVHLNAAHAPYGYDENLKSLTKFTQYGQFRTPQLRGTFEILKEYFEQLKSLGIYDNSTIIIMTDHGETPKWEFDEGDESNILRNYPMSALFIKPKGSDETPLAINTSAELSNANFQASIAELAGSETEEFGLSWFDIAKDNIPQTRILELYSFRNLTNPEYRGKYLITRNERNSNDWKYQN